MAEPAPLPEEPQVAEPVIVRDAAGNDFTVDASELDSYVRSGQYSVSPDQVSPTGEVPIRDVDGQQRLVAPGEAQERIASFLADGGQAAVAQEQATAREYGGAFQGVRALGAGIVSSVPGAIPLLSQIAPEKVEEIRGFQRYRPGLMVGGEVLGTGAQLLAGGALMRGIGAGTRAIAGAGELAAQGAGRLAATAGFAEGGLTARALGAAARGATEVGLFEANREVNQAFIEQRELQASKVASAFLNGALVGGALMGAGTVAWGGAKALGGLASQGASKVADAVAIGEAQGEGFVRGMARKLEEEFAAKSVGAGKGQFSEFAGESFARTGAKERAIELAQGMAFQSLEQKAALGKAALDRAGRAVGEAIDALSASGAKADAAPILQGLREKAIEFSGRSGPQFEKALKETKRWVTDLRGASAEGDVKKLWQFKKDLGESTAWDPGLGKFSTPAEKMKRDLYHQIDGLILKTGESTGDAAFSEAWKAANREYQAARWVNETLGQKIKSTQAASAFGFSEKLGAAAALVAGGGFTPVGVAAAGATLAAQNLSKRFGADAGTLIARAVRQGDTGALSGLVDRAVGQSVGKYLGGARGAIDAQVQAAAGTAVRQAATSPVVTNRSRETEIGKALFGAPEAKATPEPRRVAVASAPRERPARGEVSDAQVKRAVASITTAQEQRAAVLEQMAAAMPERAPELRGQLAASQRATNYLLSKIPQTKNLSATLTPQAEAPRMTQAQRDEFLTAARVVADPLSVLDSLQAGTVSRAEVDALKATAPELYQQIQGEVQAQLDARTTPLPYRKALELSTLLGVVGHPSLDPAVMRGIQQAFGQQTVAVSTPQTPAQRAPVREIKRASDWSVRKEEV